ncbi:MAG: TonB family protein [Desulfomonilia bacterium]
MNPRLLVAFLISVCIHILVLLQPWEILARTQLVLPVEDSVPVSLVEDIPQREPPEEAQETEELPNGVSFEVEGVVSDDYLELLKTKIFHAWVYPDDAIARGEDGVVKIYFELDSDGKLASIGILSSSGSSSLDWAAIRSVEEAAPFGPFTEDITTRTLRITGRFCYVLE